MIPRQESNNSQKGMHGGSWRECLLIYGVIHTYRVQSTYMYMHCRPAEDGRAYRICSDMLCTQIIVCSWLACRLAGTETEHHEAVSAHRIC